MVGVPRQEVCVNDDVLLEVPDAPLFKIEQVTHLRSGDGAHEVRALIGRIEFPVAWMMWRAFAMSSTTVGTGVARLCSL